MESARIHLVFGDDEYRVAAKAKALVDGLVPESERALGLEVIDGRVDTVNEAVEAVGCCLASLRTMGFFGGGKVTWLRGAGFLADTRTGRSEMVRERVNELAGLIKTGLPDDQALVVSADRVDKRYAFYKACKAAGAVHEFATADKAHQAEQQAMAVVRDVGGHLGLDIREDVLTAFIGKVGTGTRQIVNELEKLATYLGDRKRVEIADIEAVTSASRNVMGWDLADAFGQRDLNRCLSLVRQLVFQGEHPLMLIATLAGRVRELLLYREALDRGWLPRKGRQRQWGGLPPEVTDAFVRDLAKDPRKTHPFRVGLLADQAARFSLRSLRRMHAAVVQTQVKFVSTSLPEALVLEMLLVELLAPDQSRPGARSAVST